MYDVSCVEDVKHVQARIESILSSGLSDRDREDLESMDREMTVFLDEISEFVKQDFSRETIQIECDKLRERFSEGEFDVSLVIDGIMNEMLEKMERREKQWIDKYMSIVPESLEQHDLDKWKRDTQPIPLFVSEKTVKEYEQLSLRVNEELTKQKINYIAMLFEQLTDEEKKRLLARINSKG